MRRLLASGYFASVQASIDPDIAQADDATVTLVDHRGADEALRSSAPATPPTREYRVSATYSDVNIDGQRAADLRRARASKRKCSRPTLRFVRPPTPAGWIDTLRRRRRSAPTSKNLDNAHRRGHRAPPRDRRARARRQFGVGFFANEQEPQGAAKRPSHALYVDGEYTWRNVDNLARADAGLDGRRAARRRRSRRVDRAVRPRDRAHRRMVADRRATTARRASSKPAR